MKTFSQAVFAVMFCAVFLYVPLSLEGKVRFSDPDLSGDRLLVRALSSGGGTETQSALFLAHLTDRSLSPLSVFPEKMELIEGGKFILVHNAFGSKRISLEGGLPQSFPGFPPFAAGSNPGGRAEHTASSPDGKQLLYVEPESYARGSLVLLDETGRKTVISRDVEKPGRFFPALWSPDSRGFLYSKGGKLFFYIVHTRSAPPEERWRLIGEGSITSVVWAGPAGTAAGTAAENFYYLRGSTVYRIRGDEFFARTFYSGFLEQGTAAGKIPFTFDPGFDRFWVAPDGLSLILCKNGRDLFYYPLGINEDTQTDFASLPYVMAPRSGARITVLWPASGIATVLVTPSAGASIAYRINTKNAERSTAHGTARSFESMEIPPADNAMLSPDGNRILFWGRGGLRLYGYQSWKEAAVLSTSPVYSALWLGNNEIVSGGEERIERISLRADGSMGERKLLCLVSASRYGFEESVPETGSAPVPRPGSAPVPGRILALSGNAWYITDGVSPWIEYRLPAVREPSQTSSRYRVYLEPSSGGFFENIPMVRNITSVGTFPLIEPRIAAVLEGRPADLALERNIARVPAAEDYVFNHGSRQSRELALAFDLYDDASGVNTVLDVLKRFGIRASFFLNGEFIRRHPQSVKDIAEAGHECASMFYAPLDLSDVRYRIDRSFVERGLARNEDEFYRASGRELSLLWHPPYYALSREIAETAAAVGYRTSGRDIDSRDWLPATEARRLGIDQLAAADLIDSIMDAAEGGSIIPIRLGLLEGGRPDYLFNSLEVLLDALFREGYEVVPVSTLLDKSR